MIIVEKLFLSHRQVTKEKEQRDRFLHIESLKWLLESIIVIVELAIYERRMYTKCCFTFRILTHSADHDSIDS